MYLEIKKEVEKYGATLLAVSKLQPYEKIVALHNQGQNSFAENYVQEAMEKIEQSQNLDLEWHFIGTIQKNKLKLIVKKFELLHALDNLEHCEKLNQLCADSHCVQKILIQVNVAEEASKSGIQKSKLKDFLDKVCKLKNISVQGLMTMPPLFEEADRARPYFRELKSLGQSFGLKELSMGTSADYKVALQEGATIVRLGTVLFGERPHKNS